MTLLLVRFLLLLLLLLHLNLVPFPQEWVRGPATPPGDGGGLAAPPRRVVGALGVHEVDGDVARSKAHVTALEGPAEKAHEKGHAIRRHLHSTH